MSGWIFQMHIAQSHTNSFKQRLRSTITTIVKDYLERIRLRIRVRDYVTSWQRLKKGITGCTIYICRPFRDGNGSLDRGRKKRDQRTRARKTLGNHQAEAIWTI